jgi:hypothetical protein
MVISVEAAIIDNAILVDYLSSEGELEQPEIGRTDPNIPIDNNCKDDKLNFRMPGGRMDFEDEGDESDAIPTASRPRRAVTELESLTWDPVMSMGMRARMAMMRMRIRRRKHRTAMMDQRRMWRTEGIVLESVKISLYISDL